MQPLERGLSELLWLGAGGAVTVFPMVCFAAAALRLPLTILGFFQYLAPSITLMIAVVVYAEPVTTERWITFGMIWLALVFVSIEGLRHSWRQRGEEVGAQSAG